MSENDNKPVLALYDCRSKQDYIYRTRRMREMSDGSALLKEVNNIFIEKMGAWIEIPKILRFPMPGLKIILRLLRKLSVIVSTVRRF